MDNKIFYQISQNKALADILKKYIENKLQPYGLPPYAYTVINKKDTSKILIISSYPAEWVALYQERKLHYIDPIIINSQKRSSPFSWDENISVQLSELFLLARKYNIVNGVTFVLHDPFNNLALLSVLNPENNLCAPGKVISPDTGCLQMQLIAINEQMHKLIQANGQTTPDKYAPGDAFSPGESSVLYWVSMGKSYTEISFILGISIRTVKFHMANVVRKMKASNTRQAIRLGVERQLITRP